MERNPAKTAAARRQWDGRLVELRPFIVEQDHLPGSAQRERSLASWLANQRSRLDRGTLMDDQAKRLRAVIDGQRTVADQEWWAKAYAIDQLSSAPRDRDGAYSWLWHQYERSGRGVSTLSR
jgi:hypothetical protein